VPAMTPEDALQEAIREAGGRSALARELQVSKQAAQEWKTAPVRHVLEIERLTGVERSALRPDVYPPAKTPKTKAIESYFERYERVRADFVDTFKEVGPKLGVNEEAIKHLVAYIDLFEVAFKNAGKAKPTHRRRKKALRSK
jgi:DNA-binding transcriptional regulator YdaS (Cro superfamily)